jgi:D-sedoheptulose 7-phosphate isomerase
VSSEPTGFLYPFIEAEEQDASRLLSDLARSARAKMAESRALRTATLERCATTLQLAGEAMAGRFGGGGRLFAFGNGGSATDAEGTVELFCSPPSGRPLPAMSLVEDRAVLTALANDVGFELVFSRQIIAHSRPGDIAVGFSTSGGSLNVLRAFEEASRRGLLTVGLCGYQGGAMAASDSVDHCLVVHSDSVHRIQEAQDALVLELWSAVQRWTVGGQHPVTAPGPSKASPIDEGSMP